MTVAAVVEVAAVGGSEVQRGSPAGETGAAAAAAGAAAGMAVVAAAAGSSLAGNLPLAPTSAGHTQQRSQRGERVSQVD